MRQKNFKIVSLLTVFTIVLNVLSAVVMLQPAKAVTTASVTQSRMAASATGVTYTFALTSDAPASEVEITFPAAFTGTPATATTDCSASGNVITCTTLQTSVVVTGVTNPATVGSYDIAVNFTGDDDVTINAAIVDSDTVNVNGYINTSLTFDLDTGSTIADYEGTNQMTDDCDADACLGYAGQTTPPGDYTVDLGNLVSAEPNISADSVLHADGGTGAISYIGFDLSSNAAGGTIVSMVSANGALMRGSSVDDWDIASSEGLAAAVLAIGESFTFSGLGTGFGYGWRWYSVPSAVSTGTSYNTGATLMPHLASCSDAADEYCDVEKTTETILATGDAVEDLRGTLMIGAMANGTNPAGTYRDTLTFIATGTF